MQQKIGFVLELYVKVTGLVFIKFSSIMPIYNWHISFEIYSPTVWNAGKVKIWPDNMYSKNCNWFQF